MPLVSITSNPESLTLTVIGEYPVPVERLWAAWADPRQLERFWGPPQCPATFVEHELVVGRRSRYFLVGPSGETVTRGYWLVDRVEPPNAFVVRDGFADEEWRAAASMPEMRMEVRLEPTDEGSRFVAISSYASLEALENVVAMGVVEGIRAAISQLDDLLADLRILHSRATLELVDDTHAVVRRVVRGTLDEVWRAHHEPELLTRWCLGPDGWRMTTCEVATEVGQTYRYEWENDAGERFGFTGECLESERPRRVVTTERMLGTEGPSTTNTLVLAPRAGGRTLLELTIAYPSREVRDAILATGMVDGMERSYERIDAMFGA